jgi:hypothetical protein
MNNTNILEVKKWNYGNYSSDNYGANSIAIQVGTRKVFYSYNTVVAFCGTNSKGKYFDCTIKNYWNTTTGKHLNWLDGGNKKARLTQEEFDKQLQEFLK